MPRSANSTPRRKIQADNYTFNSPELKVNGARGEKLTLSSDLLALGDTNLNYSAGVWVKETQVRATFGNLFFILDGGSPYKYAFTIRSEITGKLGVNFWDSTNNPSLYSSVSYPRNTWYHIAFTREGRAVKLYIDGQLQNSTTISASLGVATGTSLRLVGTSAAFAGNMCKTFVYGRVLTADEIADIYANDNYPSGALHRAQLNEGTGTVGYDQSGNDMNFTLTTPTWSTDTVTGIRSTSLVPRKNLNNLIFNGDFEYAPAFTAATTTNAGWIDGTASGSAANAGYGWCFAKDQTASAQFDTSEKKSGNYSMKLSTLAVNSGARANQFRSTSALTAEGYMPVLPSTSYTVSGWVKTNLISGSSRGAYIRAQEFNGTSTTAIVTNETTYIPTTTDWTYYTKTFTTNSDTRFIAVGALIVGTTGTATLIMDAWFDDIVLTKTTPDTRTTA